MSKKLLLALWKSKSPEEFVEKILLKALRNRGLRSPRGIWADLSGTPEYKGNILRAVRGTGKYPSIIFYKKGSTGKESFYLALEQFLIKGEGKPRAKITPNVFAPLSLADFQKGGKAAGLRVKTGIGRSAGELREVLFPEELLAHDDWRGRVKADLGRGILRVELEPHVFRKVIDHNHRESFLKRYLDTISFVGGKINQNEYRKRAQLHMPYRSFFGLYSRFRGFMQEAPKKRSKGELASLIERHVGIGGNFADAFAKKLALVFTNNEARRAAQRIAEHSRFRPEDLPFHPKI